MEPTNFIPRENQTEIGSPIGSMILDQGNFTMEGTTIHNYRLRMWVDENTEIGDTPKKYGIRINVYAKQDVAVVKEINKNILNTYVYNQEKDSPTFCVTGEESTCVELKEMPETYETGTIIKYKVNDIEEKYFHVMFDEEDTLTLQQRENTVSSIVWNADSDDNTKGPLTILSALENATVGWTNVLNQTYALGSTIFKNNAFTGCFCNDFSTGSVICNVNTYTLDNRTSKARMITLQESMELGCNYNSESSCPIWMYNYLWDSTRYGGTVDQGGTSNYGYWTSSADPKNPSYAWIVAFNGGLYSQHHVLDFAYITATSQGARAVINISKYA